MAAAARHLTPTVLELGGKNPAIVTKDANVAVAAKKIVREVDSIATYPQHNNKLFSNTRRLTDVSRMQDSSVLHLIMYCAMRVYWTNFLRVFKMP